MSEDQAVPGPFPIELLMVRVAWLDSVVLNETWRPIWWYKDFARKMATIEHSTVGYLIEETNDYVLIGLNIRHDGHMMNGITIPKFSITRIHKLEQGEVHYG